VAYRIAAADATITRWFIDDANPNGPGSLDVYIAPSTGTASGGQVTAMLAADGLLVALLTDLSQILTKRFLSYAV
jgi:hypothetical protein